LNILVLMKQTFDTEEKIVIQKGEIQEEGVEFVIKPYDEYAVEEAVRLCEEHGGEVTVITLGPSRAESALRTALAMGADKAIIIEHEEEVEIIEAELPLLITAQQGLNEPRYPSVSDSRKICKSRATWP